jgi:single-strand DNA-binding protein
MANDTNIVVLVGRLTRDAELKYTNSGMAVCRFSIANNKRKKSGDGWVDSARFFDVVLWGKAGEAINQYLVKGKQVAIEGELEQDRWEQEGKARSKVEVSAHNVQLLGGGTERPEGAAGAKQSSAPPPRQDAPASEERVPNAPEDVEREFTDDIPF